MKNEISNKQLAKVIEHFIDILAICNAEYRNKEATD